MTSGRSLRIALKIVAVALFLISSFVLVSAEKQSWTKRDKAFFADENTLAFVRPGLQIDLLSASIAEDGTTKARVKFTDDKGVPLDRMGIMTPGEINARWTLAVLPADKAHYMTYATNSSGQATNDSGGVWTEIADGEYEYTFGRKAPSGYDRTASHRVSVSAARDLTEWELGVNLAEEVIDFVPDGSPVTKVRDIVRTETCNECHQGLQLHGETGRTTVEGCIMCHQPQSVDPDSGNTVDFTTMIHKIHMGSSLPSVQAGTPYQIIGYGNSVHDFSDVVYPANVLRCQTCHDPNNGAAQQDHWLTNPNRAACGSCHDNVNFATGENHAGLPQVSDNQCANCHVPQGELEFDLSIMGAHTIPTESQELPGLVVDLLEVSDGMAGQHPTVTFTVKDKEGNPVDAASLDRLRLGLDGPTTDYPMPPIQEDATSASGGSDGTYTYTFDAMIPADATGSWAVAVEARKPEVLLPGTVSEVEVEDQAMNDVLAFSVDGSPAMPRRTIVSREKCNDCHYNLSLHGDNRKAIEYCVMCHNPNATDAEVRPADQMPAESIDFRTMIHRIHTGAELARVQNGENYIIYGFRSAVVDYSDVEYPGKRNNCEGCHVGDSQQLPLNQNLLEVTDPRGWLNPAGPAAAACLSCHGNIQAASHALANTSALGESCSTCHGPGKTASVDKVHAE